MLFGACSVFTCFCFVTYIRCCGISWAIESGAKALLFSISLLISDFICFYLTLKYSKKLECRSSIANSRLYSLWQFFLFCRCWAWVECPTNPFSAFAVFRFKLIFHCTRLYTLACSYLVKYIFCILCAMKIYFWHHSEWKFGSWNNFYFVCSFSRKTYLNKLIHEMQKMVDNVYRNSK